MANPKLAPQYYQKNAITFQAHRRQVMWQIYLPIALVILLVILAGILVILAPTLKVSRWADIALIMLISTTMLAAFIFLALNILSIYGMRRALQMLPYYLFMGQGFMYRLRSRLLYISDRAVEPVLWTRSNFAKLQAIQPKSKKR
jgi:uncharacterized membrane protein